MIIYVHFDVFIFKSNFRSGSQLQSFNLVVIFIKEFCGRLLSLRYILRRAALNPEDHKKTNTWKEFCLNLAPGSRMFYFSAFPNLLAVI